MTETKPPVESGFVEVRTNALIFLVVSSEGSCVEVSMTAREARRVAKMLLAHADRLRGKKRKPKRG